MAWLQIKQPVDRTFLLQTPNAHNSAIFSGREARCRNGLAGSADVLAQKRADYLWLSAAWKTQRKRPSAGLQFERKSNLSHLNISQVFHLSRAMKVQLISDSAVHTSRTKARREERGWQQFSDNLRLRKSPWSLKDTGLIIDLLTGSRDGGGE